MKTFRRSRWHDAAMLRLPALVPTAVLTAALVLVGGAATAVVKNGGPGDDKLKGTNQTDTLRGRGGDDRLFGLGGDDLLVGGPDDDVVKGGQGLDDLGGGTGNDRVVAGFDNLADRTYGGPGADVIFIWGADSTSGGTGDDKIIATYPDPDMDILCGSGHDEVIFNEAHPGVFLDGCEDVRVESAG
jgi:Ca2+-binding RTX toxin-like protein